MLTIMTRLFRLFALLVLVLENLQITWACPNIISRIRWGATSPKEIEFAIIPVQNVIVHHTESQGCTSERRCSEILKNMQDFHMNDKGFHDIAYNFLIGGDGNIYEGVGWHKVGAHTRGYNSRSLGLAFIGDFTDQKPSEKMLKAARDFLECGVELGELDSRYKLFGARQVRDITSPGLALYHEIINWPHFSSNPK